MEAQAGEANQTQGTAPDGASTSNAQAPETSAPRGPEDFRFGDDPNVPSWARGKSASELLELSSQMYSALQSGANTSPSTPSPSPAPAPQASMNNAPNGIPSVDPNLIYSNPDEYHRQMEARTNAIIEARLAQAGAEISTPLASMAKSQAMTHRPDVWERYGPEIESTMASMPANARGNVETWKRIVNYVAGEHVDELARIKAEELMASGGSGSLPTQAGSSTLPNAASTRSPIQKLFDEGHEAVKGFVMDGISPAQVEAHARARGHDLESYATILKNRVARKKGVPA